MTVGFLALAVVLTCLGAGVRAVPRGSVGLVERDGRYRRTIRRRIGWVLPGVDRLVPVDLSAQRLALGPLSLRSQDGLPLVGSVALRYSVVEPVRATYRAPSVRGSVDHLARHELQMMLAGLPSEEILSRDLDLSGALGQHLSRAEDAWGIRVDQVAADLKVHEAYGGAIQRHHRS